MSLFYQRIREQRMLRGLYQRQMAELANISVRAYQLYEQGKTEPNIDALIKFADALNVSIDYLVGRTSNPAPLNDVGE
ncbi:helix-turn-helix domain-containing protein [Mediterraneibacter massiliensis]|jgi:transcriptional regulator with XRE-family HTH domain|uniref:helix-turn-helix domain-containing protein n=1 Tax=Mediterraneibacter massiliensis TaxID=1720300 RepID=UPI00205251A8|nr:helix-turn-helix transcriptional regulator [Mediterraneibacter massiliensis]DAS83794.1 MAG TPA: helix-turn-helix domain protein [Caudoviricetes sp.]